MVAANLQRITTPKGRWHVAVREPDNGRDGSFRDQTDAPYHREQAEGRNTGNTKKQYGVIM